MTKEVVTPFTLSDGDGLNVFQKYVCTIIVICHNKFRYYVDKCTREFSQASVGLLESMWSCALACNAGFSPAVAGSIHFLYRFGNYNYAEQNEGAIICEVRGEGKIA